MASLKSNLRSCPSLLDGWKTVTTDRKWQNILLPTLPKRYNIVLYPHSNQPNINFALKFQFWSIGSPAWVDQQLGPTNRVDPHRVIFVYGINTLNVKDVQTQPSIKDNLQTHDVNEIKRFLRHIQLK